jgi:hypothetical protein
MIEVSRHEFEPTRHADGRQSPARSIFALSLGLIVMVCVTATASAEPPQTAPGSGATGAAASTSEQKVLDQELQQFAKLPVDKAMDAYGSVLVNLRDAESEYDELRLKTHREFVSRCESEFKKRIPSELSETFKRMTDRSVRHSRLLAILKMQESERTAAQVKDASEERRVWKLRHQFDDDVVQGKISDLANLQKSTAQPIKEKEAKVQALRTKADKLEPKLFPRLSRDQVVILRRFVNVSTRAHDTILDELKAKLDAAAKESSLKEIQCRVPPELEAAFRRTTDRKARDQRRLDLTELHGAERTAAKRKDAAEEQKIREIADAVVAEMKRQEGPMTIKADLDASDVQEKINLQEEKCTSHRARSQRLEDLLNAKDGR